MENIKDADYNTQMTNLYDMKQKRPCFDDQFKNHEVEYEEYESKILGKVVCWRWKQPGSCIHSTTFRIEKGILFVSGDYGEATYRWNSPISIDFLYGCSEDYIHEKCTSSSKGRNFISWNEEKLKEWIEEFKKEEIERSIENRLYKTKDPFGIGELEWDEELTEEQFVEIIKPYIDEDYKMWSYDSFEWQNFLAENGDEYFGSNWWEFTGSAGETPDTEFICQMESLKRSIEKLIEKNNKKGQ